jgi:hypothetical protein
MIPCPSFIKFSRLTDSLEGLYDCLLQPSEISINYMAGYGANMVKQIHH